jgi:hypothetical protein
MPHWHVAEVAPAAPFALEALANLLLLAALFFALGGIKLVVAFIDFTIWMIRKTVGHIPFAGGAIEGLAKRGAQKLTNALGAAEQGLDSYIGWTWHNMGILVRQAAREIVGLAHDLWLVGAVIPTLVSAVVMRHFVSALLHPIRTAQHIIHRLLHTARVAVHLIEHTVTAGVYPRIRAGEAALDRVIEWDIPRLRARERILGREITNLRKWVRAHARPVATAAFVAAVAVALRRLGGNWIRCKNWRRIGKHVCGLPTSLIEDLLTLGLAFGVLIDPEKTAELAVDAVDFVEPLVRRMLGAAAGAEQDAVDALAGLLS